MEDIENDPLRMVRLGLRAVREIGSLAPHRAPPRVCHHFSPYAEEGSGKLKGALVGALQTLDVEFDVDVVGGAFGVECWESVMPSVAWVEARIPQMCAAARESGVHYDGWSWEPLDGPAITASPNVKVLRAARSEN